MTKNKNKRPLVEDERNTQIEASASEEADVESKKVGGQSNDEEQLEAEKVEEILDTDEQISAEEAAVTTDNATAHEANDDSKLKKAKALDREGKEAGQSRIRGKKYKKATQAIDKKRKYGLDEAIEIAKNRSYSRFDGSIEIHIRLKQNSKGASEAIRGLIQLPQGAIKTPNVGVVTEDLIEKIAKDKKTEFDILISPKTLMPKIAKIAKILGPQGKMPSPKAGTVVDNPQEVVDKIKLGRVEYRADKQNIIHLAIGKVSWPNDKILENTRALIGVLPKAKIISIYFSATMGPGIGVDLGSI